ncbi:RICIN domain-containing protein, partial [Streptomyces sp. NPDC006997]|uniref:RICIN domain-containing protein n=1 Tax=Streptomyces sp. NPDC006997 TaxID=3155356 RepID=UPI0033DFE14F
QRPLVLGTVGVTVAVLVIGSLVALGTHGPTDGDSQTTGADQPSVSLEPSTPPTPVTVTPTLSSRAYTPPPPSPSPKHTREAKKKRTPPPKPKPTHRTPKATPKPDPEPTPKSTPESDADPAVPTGAVLIRNKKYGYCVDVPGTGKGRPDGKVQDAACEASAADNQRWTLERRVRGGGTRGADLYLIRNAKDGLCFDLPNYGPVGATTPVTEYHCDGTSADNQLWWLDRRPDGAYWIRNQKSGDLCLDVSRTDREAAHTNVTVFPCSDTDDHRWVFRKP